jgi:hypothetical protein
MAFILGIIYFVLLITLGIISIRKGHWVMFIFGIFIPLFWLIGALLPSRDRLQRYRLLRSRPRCCAAGSSDLRVAVRGWNSEKGEAVLGVSIPIGAVVVVAVVFETSWIEGGSLKAVRLGPTTRYQRCPA